MLRRWVARQRQAAGSLLFCPSAVGCRKVALGHGVCPSLSPHPPRLQVMPAIDLAWPRVFSSRRVPRARLQVLALASLISHLQPASCFDRCRVCSPSPQPPGHRGSLVLAPSSARAAPRRRSCHSTLTRPNPSSGIPSGFNHAVGFVSVRASLAAWDVSSSIPSAVELSLAGCRSPALSRCAPRPAAAFARRCCARRRGEKS